MFDNLFRRLASGADNPLQIIIELLLIGVSVNWCAGVLHGTRGTRLLRGLLVLFVMATLVVELLAATLDWARLELLYRYFVIGLAFIALVAFQPELRRALIRAGDVRFLRRMSPRDKLIAALTETAGYLSRHKFGGLIAIQREIGLANWAENGTQINADVSANLLEAIFFPNNPLHDLGVIIRDTRVVAAGCQFPVAESGEVDSGLGSRHRAAVGLSAESDALVLVVSEETGTISLADRGQLSRFLSLDDLEQQLQERLSGASPAHRHRRINSISDLWRYVRRFLIVAPLTLVIWFLADQASLMRKDGISIRVQFIGDTRLHVDIERPDPPVFQLAVRGSTRAVEKLMATTASEPLLIRVPIRSPYDQPGHYAPSGQDLIRLLQDLPELRQREIIVDAIVPDTLRFNVDQVVTLPEVPLRVDAGAFRVQVERIDPPNVHVRLRRRDAEALGATLPALILRMDKQLADLKPGAKRVFSAVPVPRQLGSAELLDVAPPTARVELRVVSEKATRRLEQIAVAYYVSPQIDERVEIERQDVNEWLVELEITGDRNVVEALDPADVRAFVEINSDDVTPSSEFRPFDVTVELPPGVSLVGPPPTVHLRFQLSSPATP